MANKKYKALFVLEPVHHEVVVEAKKARRTINDFLSDLLETHKYVVETYGENLKKTN